MKLSAIIITDKTELGHFLLKSLSFADEIIIIMDSTFPVTIHDSPMSSSRMWTDGPRRGRSIPNRNNLYRFPIRSGMTHEATLSTRKCKIFYRPLNDDFAAQRNFALTQAKSEWVLFVDDDEYVGTELGKEITEAIQNPNYSGYYIRRLDIVYHKPLLHGETGNIKILRLGKRLGGKFSRSVHETWKIKGRVGELYSPLYHTKNHFVSEFITRMSRYGQIDANILSCEQKPFSWFRLFIYPAAKFTLNYFIKLGFLDGTPGMFLAYLLAVQSLTVRIFQWESRN